MNPKKNSMLAIISSCIVIFILLSGCIGLFSLPGVKKVNVRPDPESGISNWMEAMNSRDVARLYDLSPDTIQRQISLEEFKKANTDNPFFLRNVTFVKYDVINKTAENDHAKIVAQLVMAQPQPGSANVTYTGIFYVFDENYQKNEWKVWATGP